jgi:hypothetical protein
VDDFLQRGGALIGVLDTADEEVDLVTHILGDGGETFCGHILRTEQAHRGLHKDFRDLAHALGVPEIVGEREGHGHGTEEQQQQCQHIGVGGRPGH